MPREVATVLFPQLNVHRVPGDREEDIVGQVRYGDKFTVLEHTRGQRARWLRIGKDRWIAERNFDGEVFARVDRIADPPKPQPAVIEQPARPFPLVPVTLGFLAVLLFLMWLAW